MKLAIIGAGASGLTALRHSLKEGHDCELYEQTDQIGGTWVYTNETEVDSFGLPIHSSMYSGLQNMPYNVRISMQHWDKPRKEIHQALEILDWEPERGETLLEYLQSEQYELNFSDGRTKKRWRQYIYRTNLPKELMLFEDFPYTDTISSFISQFEVLNYINQFAKTYNLLPYIKFYTHVEKISPIALNRWLVTVRDLKTNLTTEKEFDAVMVCVGNFSVPLTPQITGMDIFEGTKIHSHKYRNTEPYKSKNVLIVGSGSSGTDIARILSDTANKVYLSYRSTIFVAAKIPKSVIIKPLVSRLGKNSVLFIDNTEETINDIIFCTGYRYSYPFLTPECGIEVDQNCVKFLYKHIINIKNPTMAFIGIPTYIVAFPIFGIQVRFFLSYLKGAFLISQKEMMDDLMEYIKKRKEQGVAQQYYHRLALDQEAYTEELAGLAKIPGLPKVLFEIFKFILQESRGDRSIIFKVKSDTEFDVIKPQDT